METRILQTYYDTAKAKMTNFNIKAFIFNKLYNQIFVIYNFKYETEMFKTW